MLYHTGFNYSVGIAYKDIFDDFETLDVKAVIANIPTSMAIKTAAHFLAQLHTEKTDDTTQIDFLIAWTGRIDNESKKRVINFINKNSDVNKSTSFLNNFTLLQFEQLILQNSNQIPEKDTLTAEEELALLKVYLYIFQKWTDQQEQWVVEVQKTDDFKASTTDVEKAMILIFPSQFAIEEFNKIKDFRIQFYKSKYFFEFAELDKTFAEYLFIFLNRYGFKSWKEYLTFLLSIYVRPFDGGQSYSALEVPKNFVDIVNFMDTLSIDIRSDFRSNDFLEIRNSPVMKQGFEYVFLNLNFFVDKIYQGIQFMLGTILVQEKALYKGNPIKSVPTFLSIFGTEFSETKLFYKIIEKAFSRLNYLLINGETIKEMIGDGGPDFYMRDKTKIYIFEFKNVYIPAEVKSSYDYEKIKKSIENKFVENERGKPKGVTQLANVIEMGKKGAFKSFDDYDFNAATIFPIIVYVDSTLDIFGFNYLLNGKFKLALSQNDTDTQGIKDLTCINLDIFIKFEALFRQKQMNINNLITEYHERTKKAKSYQDVLYPFDYHVQNKVRKIKNYDWTPSFMKDVLGVIGKENQ